jgi:hypothetical protein
MAKNRDGDSSDLASDEPKAEARDQLWFTLMWNVIAERWNRPPATAGGDDSGKHDASGRKVEHSD